MQYNIVLPTTIYITNGKFSTPPSFAPLTTAELKEKAFFVYKNEHFFCDNFKKFLRF